MLIWAYFRQRTLKQWNLQQNGGAVYWVLCGLAWASRNVTARRLRMPNFSTSVLVGHLYWEVDVGRSPQKFDLFQPYADRSV